MKAKAWFLMMLAMVVSFAGFGNTTADLTKNSEPEEITCVHMDLDLGSVEVIVVDNRFEELFRQADSAFSANHKDEINEMLEVNQAINDFETWIVPPLIQCQDIIPLSYSNSIPINGRSKFHERKYSTNYNFDRYRRARDGLRQARS